MKSWLIGKDSDAGRDWGQEEKGTTEDEMVGWHHQLDGREFEWTLGVGDGQGGLACCGSWGRKESDTTEQLNWTELNLVLCVFLSQGTLFSTYCWIVNTELIANGPICHSWIKTTYHLYFLCKVHHSLPVLRNIRQCKQHFSTTRVGCFKQWNHQQNAQKCEKYGTKLWKDTSLEYES